MKISIELDQEWDTALALLEYLRLLSRTLERICEMEAEAPMDWFLLITRPKSDEYKIEITHQ